MIIPENKLSVPRKVRAKLGRNTILLEYSQNDHMKIELTVFNDHRKVYRNEEQSGRACSGSALRRLIHDAVQSTLAATKISQISLKNHFELINRYENDLE
jgi:hypothetical protein